MDRKGEDEAVLDRCLACMNPVAPEMTVCPFCGTPVPCPPNSPASLQPGYELGRFVIGREIGRGGIGITYIAFDRRLQSVRCIKEYFPRDCRRLDNMRPEILPADEQKFRKYATRFLDEARIMSLMSNQKVPNVVAVHDQIDMNGTTYIIMDYLDGCTLDEYISRNGHPLTWQQAAEIMKTILKTVSEVHRQGYLHRDISLNNIFRLTSGGVRLIDFGSAERVEDAQKHPEKVWYSNKKFYTPPEQAGALSQGLSADIYALGVCMFKMVAGGFPQNWRPATPFPSLTGMNIQVPRRYDEVVFKATQPDPAARYQSAEEMLRDVESIGEAQAPVPPAPPVPAGEKPRKAPVAGIVLGGVGLIAVIGLAIALSGTPREPGAQTAETASLVAKEWVRVTDRPEDTEVPEPEEQATPAKQEAASLHGATRPTEGSPEPTAEPTPAPTMSDKLMTEPPEEESIPTAVPAWLKTAEPTGRKTSSPITLRTATPEPDGNEGEAPVLKQTAMPEPTAVKTLAPVSLRTELPGDDRQRTDAPAGTDTPAPEPTETKVATAEPAVTETEIPVWMKTPTPEPKATPERTQTPGQKPTATPTAVPPITPERTQTPGQKPTATPTAVPPETHEPTPTTTPVWMKTREPSPEPKVTDWPGRLKTPTPVPAVKNTKTPSWFRTPTPEPATQETDSLVWMKNPSSSLGTKETVLPGQSKTAPRGSEGEETVTPVWMKKATPAPGSEETAVPVWMKTVPPSPGAEETTVPAWMRTAAPEAGETATPVWMKKATPVPETEATAVPAWMRTAPPEAGETATPVWMKKATPAPETEETAVPAWMKTATPEPGAGETATPVWMKRATPAPETEGTAVPAWMKTATPAPEK